MHDSCTQLHFFCKKPKEAAFTGVKRIALKSKTAIIKTYLSLPVNLRPFKIILHLPQNIHMTNQASIISQLAVRVIAKGGKFLGDDISGATVTVRHAQTGELLASGQTKGGSGDLWNIMINPHTRTEPIPDTGASIFLATIKSSTNTPIPLLITATGPGAGLQSTATTSTTQWIMPGVANGNNTITYSCLLELPGLIVQVMEPATHLNITQALPQTVSFTINVAMMCGCPIDNNIDTDTYKNKKYTFPNPWPVDDFVVGCYIICNEKQVAHFLLNFDKANAPGRYTGQWQMQTPGFYTGHVYAYQKSTGNTGIGTISFFQQS